MDELHQLVRVSAILFAVAEEYVCVESIADALCHLVADQYRFKIFFQLLVVFDGGEVIGVRIKVLTLAEFFRIELLNPRLHHYRKDGQLLLRRIREVRVHRRIRLGKQTEGDGDDDEVGASKVGLKVSLVYCLRKIFLVIDRAIVGSEYIVADLFEIFLEILRMAGEIDPRFFLYIAFVVRFKKQICHIRSPFRDA